MFLVKSFLQIDNITSTIDALIILIQMKLNPEHQIIRRKRRSVLYILRKNVCYLSILKKSMISQKMNLKSDLANNLIEKLLSRLPILKRQSSAKIII